MISRAAETEFYTRDAAPHRTSHILRNLRVCRWGRTTLLPFHLGSGQYSGQHEGQWCRRGIQRRGRSISRSVELVIRPSGSMLTRRGAEASQVTGCRCTSKPMPACQRTSTFIRQ